MGNVAELAAPVDEARLAQIALQHEVEQFLYHEAALLDDRRHWDWYALLAEDLEYWMPVRSTRTRADMANEFAPLGGAAFFDEDKHLMGERIRKLDTPYSWSEDPPSRTRHYVSNVRIAEQRDGGELLVHVNFLIYRSRLARDEDLWAGRREDLLRRVGDSFQIVKRHIYSDQVSLKSKNLSSFF